MEKKNFWGINPHCITQNIRESNENVYSRTTEGSILYSIIQPIARTGQSCLCLIYLTYLT